MCVTVTDHTPDIVLASVKSLKRAGLVTEEVAETVTNAVAVISRNATTPGENLLATFLIHTALQRGGR